MKKVGNMKVFTSFLQPLASVWLRKLEDELAERLGHLTALIFSFRVVLYGVMTCF